MSERDVVLSYISQDNVRYRIGHALVVNGYWNGIYSANSKEDPVFQMVKRELLAKQSIKVGIDQKVIEIGILPDMKHFLLSVDFSEQKPAFRVEMGLAANPLFPININVGVLRIKGDAKIINDELVTWIGEQDGGIVRLVQEGLITGATIKFELAPPARDAEEVARSLSQPRRNVEHDETEIRSTPDKYKDQYEIRDRQGRRWRYSEESDTWCLVLDNGTLIRSSVRSFQRMVYEFGPYRDVLGNGHEV